MIIYKYTTIVLAALMILTVPLVSYSAVPQTINYQGYLTDKNNVPVNGVTSITFSIYDVNAGGTALWTETQSIDVSAGVYSVELGLLTPVSLFFDVQYWLGIDIAGDGEMTPRQPITSIGQAIRSDIADDVADGSIKDDMISDGAVSLQKLADTCAVGESLIKTDSGWSCGPSPY